jgi:hypothetical protein
LIIFIRGDANRRRPLNSDPTIPSKDHAQRNSQEMKDIEKKHINARLLKALYSLLAIQSISYSV